MLWHYEMAERAAQAAPNDPQLWFLLGYAARLNAKFQAIGGRLQQRPSPKPFVTGWTLGIGSRL
jgi:hypothetical protein